MDATTTRRGPFPVSVEDLSDGGNGICLTCGAIEYGGIEPDAERYPCGACGSHRVYGLEQALLLGRVAVVAEEGDEDLGEHLQGALAGLLGD